MAIRITFEIGHIASPKNKITSDGFTHDWELFVRGCDSNDISHCIDKVVFNLHDSFPKPKRGKLTQKKKKKIVNSIKYKINFNLFIYYSAKRTTVFN